MKFLTKTKTKMGEYKIEGKSVEKYWTDKIAKNLVGRKITRVEYVSDKEVEESMWYRKPIAICLDNKYWLVPMSDDEGNDGGALSTTFKDLGTIPVI
jgi:hypothetical protein